ncbi:HCNGP-like protein-domain-containing protein [Xylariaceae sp. FL0255]|nr:HCNGP-like protein-domain-containing protein [Xylariaceae sp. FL0255]
MAGLVAYDSSDEDEDVKPQSSLEPLRKTEKAVADASSSHDPIPKPEAIPVAAPAPGPGAAQQQDEKQAVYGPQIGPSAPSASAAGFAPLPEVDEEPQLPNPRPGSPYTATRALLRDLTLPPVPNMDIPPSPRGSPSPSSQAAAAATDKKFEHFLSLKRKGVHFNSRVASNPAMKNPALMDKLLAFADMGGDNTQSQYRTSLPSDILPSPSEYARTAYKEQLRLSQSEISQARARGKGAPVEFVPAGGKDGNNTSVGAAQQASSTGAKRKTRFDN